VKGLLIACFQALKSTGGWGIFKWPQVGDFGWPPGDSLLVKIADVLFNVQQNVF
jgi:hypothetical protein